MFASLKQRLGIVSVSTTPTYIVVQGIDTMKLFKDIYAVWGSTVIQKNMFSIARGSEVRMRHFFGLDFLYICQTLYNAPATRLPRRVLAKIIEELKNETWLGQIDRDTKSITDLSVIEKQVPFPLKPFQREFIKHYGIMVPAYRLKGYLLDAGPGTGKTVTGLLLGAALHADKVIILTPKNAINRVWEDTIKDLMLEKKPYWISTGNEMPKLEDHYYICHYESLEIILNFVKTNAGKLKNILVVLDESHNFNRQEALRTQMLVELCKLPQVGWCEWASGTPIMAMGVECIPFLRCVDPLFDQESEERFRKIYGRDAKRANDILRNRIGHLKYHVPKQDVVNIQVNVRQVMIKTPNAYEFTLMAIGEKMKKFIEQRRIYYKDNFGKYREDYNRALEDFKLSLSGPQERMLFAKYKECFKTVSSGFDPRLMKEEAAFCNNYELRTIMPRLHPMEKPLFKSARSVLKYVDLKIMGECLGGILGKERTRCHVEMVPYIGLPAMIDNAKKKTLIFTSFVEVVERANVLLKEEGYKPALVYGATNKDLSSIVSNYYKDPDLNPLAATFQSLSTAVPLTVANTIVMINQPFRSGVRDQTIARAARLGQDEEVDVLDCLLDTGDQPNISTRSNDIMEWSQQQVASIVGVKNVDLDSLALEARDSEMDEWTSHLTQLALEAGDSGNELCLESKGAVVSREPLPHYLYHGSMFHQSELMPGFKRSGNLVKWDGCEDNTWLYTTADRDEAILLGISSAIEKVAGLKHYKHNADSKTMSIEFYDKPMSVSDIYKLPVFLYSIRAEDSDGWMANYNTTNGLVSEYKTQSTIDGNIVRCESIDVRNALHGYRITVK